MIAEVTEGAVAQKRPARHNRIWKKRLRSAKLYISISRN
jgi:hypothetical protein